MAIALSGTPIEATATATDTLTVSYTAAAGTVIVVSALNTALTVTGITYNSGTWVELFESVSIAGAVLGGVWICVDGADGSAHDLVMTFSASQGGNFCHAIVSAWSGVVTTSAAAAHRTVYTDDTDYGDLDITVSDAVAGDVVLHGVANWGTDLGAVETTVFLKTGIYGGSYDHLVQYKAAAGSDAMARTGGQIGAAWAFALIPSGGSSSSVFTVSSPLRW